MRVVGSGAGPTAFTTPSSVAAAAAAAPTAAAPGAAPVKIAIAPGGRLAPQASAQRLLLPAGHPGGGHIGGVTGVSGVSGAGMETQQLLRTGPNAYTRPKPTPALPRIGRPPITASTASAASVGSSRAQVGAVSENCFHDLNSHNKFSLHR